MDHHTAADRLGIHRTRAAQMCRYMVRTGRMVLVSKGGTGWDASPGKYKLKGKWAKFAPVPLAGRSPAEAGTSCCSSQSPPHAGGPAAGDC